MKELTPQIAALYLGCECTILKSTENVELEKDTIATLIAVNLGDVAFFMDEENIFEDCPIELKYVKPILRRLSSMTEEEIREFGFMSWSMLQSAKTFGVDFGFKPTEFTWLLSKHFDLFGLIDSGLAIDKATI